MKQVTFLEAMELCLKNDGDYYKNADGDTMVKHAEENYVILASNDGSGRVALTDTWEYGGYYPY